MIPHFPSILDLQRYAITPAVAHVVLVRSTRCLVIAVLFAVIRIAAAESTGSSTGRAIDDIPEALDLMRAAGQVHVFRVTVIANRQGEVTPHGDYKHARAIGADARRSLGRLLGKYSSWCHCLDHTVGVGPEPKYVGFVFQRGKDKLVLLRFLRWHTESTLNGAYTGGSLNEKASDQLDEWEKRYARPERGLNMR